ncbi:M15 family metallopeptidase [Niallia taxi]|uniref:peptidoglycan-binding protein n=1 Tax=Niallia taxi TaxID=2499688 RepID=UPI002934531D|nr:peptidoglycan-binding protein [Niallia taxi]WOD61752.1 M15 family metallopeptidase [Niallia taxi]
MDFTPTYHERNLENIAQLGDNTKDKAIEWYQYLIENKIDILIYETIRSEATQKANFAKGASQTMKSYHIVGQALDFVPVDGKTTLWNGYGSAEAKKAISYAKKLGFEWGGDWSSFVDKPHLEYAYKGYGTDTFKTKGNKITLVTKKATTVKTETKTETKKTTYTLPTGTYKKGSKGTAVKQIQEALNKLYFKCGTADGIWGAKTEDALRRFQSVHCNPVDGIYGKNTRAAMLKQLNK